MGLLSVWPPGLGWEVVLNKTWTLATLFLIYLCKDTNLKHILKIYKYGEIISHYSLVPFQYKGMHSITILKFFVQIIGFIDFRHGGGRP